MITAQLEMTTTMLDGTTPEAFIDFAREFNPQVIGISGYLFTVVDALRTLETAGKPPDAVLVNVFCPGSEIDWRETPASLANGLAPIIKEGRIPIIGIGRTPRADFVTALSKLL